MTFDIKISNKGNYVNWTEDDVINKLNNIADAKKNVTWIRSDLTTSKSNWFSRIMWCIVKCFQWMRSAFYKVDLENSKKILNQLKPQIQNGDKALIHLFNKAVKNFNSIAPKHKADLIDEQEEDFQGADGPADEGVNLAHSLPKTSVFGPGLDNIQDHTHSNDPLVHSYVKTSSSVSSNLLQQLGPYNHGKMHYNDAKKLVDDKTHLPGTYLIRQSWDSDSMVVTIKHPVLEHIKFKIEKDKFININGKVFATLKELVESHGGELLYPIRAGATHPAKTIHIPLPGEVEIPAAGIASLFDPKPNASAQEPVISSVEMHYVKALQEGKDIDELLEKAFKAGQPAIAAWLIQKGASLKALQQKALNWAMHGSKMDLLEWLDKVAQKEAPTPDKLEHFAIELGLGYKSANLLVMEHKVEKMNENLKTAVVKVPPFLPVGDFELSHYLFNQIPEVFDLWNQFKSTFDPALKQSYLDATTNEKASKSGMKITNEGDVILGKISDKITAHFSNKPYHTLQMKEWLEKEKPSFVIVRSTGKEDSDTNSNAGGNASIPYVEPDAKSISEAIGVVIASYFGEKSINQRILCGDRTLLTDEKPFLPILIQEMVGENVGGKGSKNEDVPRCGVLFTRQSDKAEGVTFIQTGLGNNEGVVTSQVGVDSYYVKNSKVHAVVRQKETRFVSTANAAGKMGVSPILNNDMALEYNQALPNDIILDIKRVADDISTSYAKEKGKSKPMDMEYTVKLKEKGSNKPVIYLLQARPLLGTQGDNKVKQSYLDLKELKKIASERKLSAGVLLDGNAYVRKITNSNSIIFADDLPKGQYDYAHTSEDVKAIIIKKTAPATSHEAVILRPKGVAVFVVENPEEFEALKKRISSASDEKPVLLDPQRGIIVSPEKDTADKLVKEGLVSYPIPLEVTVPPSRMFEFYKDFRDGKIQAQELKLRLDEFNKSGTDLINFLRGDEPLLKVSKVADDGGYEINELIDLMGTGETQQAKLALATLLHLMKVSLANNLKGKQIKQTDFYKPMFQVLEAALKLSQTEIIPALTVHKPESLERLYPIKFLHSMLLQQFNKSVMGCYSYLNVAGGAQRQMSAIEKGAQHGVKFDGPNAQAIIYLQHTISKSFSEECSTNWQTFVRDLSKLSDKQAAGYINKITPIITQVNTLEIGALWLNTEFKKVWKQYGSQSGVKRIENVINALGVSLKGDKPIFDWIAERTGFIKVYEDSNAAWVEPLYAKKQTAKLIKDFTGEFGFHKNNTKNSLAFHYAQSGNLGKLALLQYIRRAVNAYDCTIKAVKGSDKFKDDKEKALQVAEMLQGYFDMMQSTFNLIPDKAEQHTLQKPSMGSAVHFDEYIKSLKDGRAYKFGFANHCKSTGFAELVTKIKNGSANASEQLEARNGTNDPKKVIFSVDSLVIGSKADLDFSAHWPDRLEEYFTTFHQNMEQIVKYLNTKNGLNVDLLSTAAKQIAEKTNVVFQQQISYINEDSGKLRVGYQIPLRQHSANLMIDYDPQKPELGLDITVQMFGNDEHNRWDQAAAFGAILAHSLGGGFVNGTTPKINYNNPEGAEFTLKVPVNFNEVDKLMNTIYYITKTMTMGSVGSAAQFLSQILQKLGDVKWKELNPEAYQYSLFLNSTLITQLVTKGDQETAAKIAIQSFKGLTYYKIDDYTKAGGSLKTVALQQILSALPLIPALVKEVKMLTEDSDFQKRFAGECTKLKQALAGLVPTDQAYAQFMQSKDYAEAITLALKAKDSQLLGKVNTFINEKFTSGEYKLLLDLAKNLLFKGLEKEAEDLIIKKGLEAKLSPDELSELHSFKNKGARAELATKLDANVGALKGAVANFDVNHAQIMKLCADSLIGLSQCVDYQVKSFGSFGQLDQFLGNAKYDYVQENIHGDTSKLRKAAPLYIIRGLESKKPEVRQSALTAFQRLALDYAVYAHSDPDIVGINHMIFALARGYLDTAPNTDTAAQELFLMFQKQKDIIQKIINSGKIVKISTLNSLTNAIK